VVSNPFDGWCAAATSFPTIEDEVNTSFEPRRMAAELAVSLQFDSVRFVLEAYMTRARRPLAFVAPALLAGVALVGLTGCSKPEPANTVGQEADPVWQRATAVFQPLPAEAPSAENPVTAAKVALGKRLYFDPQLSKQGNVSCNSCHELQRFGADELSFSPGDDGRLGGRNSPTVLNAALHVAQFWDGRASTVEEQAGMPILNPVEMAIPDEAFLVDRLRAAPGYPEAFAAAFPDEDPAITYPNIRFALAAFERTLLTPAPFDAYLRGDRAALDAREQAGLVRFMDLHCTACHNGVTVGARFFRKFGLNEPYWVHTRSAKPDEGRYAQTGEPEDLYVFKVASLRNVAETAPYFHDGSVATLEEAVKIIALLQVGVTLDDGQAGEIAAFLRTLTGELPADAQAPESTSAR
jgi:cytochrome c peroxidase